MTIKSQKDYKSIDKEPYEEASINVDFGSKMKDGASLTTPETGYPTAFLLPALTTDLTSSVIKSSSIAGNVVTVGYKAGTDGQRIKVTIRVNDDQGEKHESGFILDVVDR